MATIQKTIDAFLQTKRRITEQLNIMNQLRKQENELIKEIKSYLNEKNESGIRIDENTFISISNQDKKIHLTKKEYEQRVKDLLYKRGIDDEEFTKELLNKVSDVIQQQKLKVKKEK
jgi:hypothetical protein